MKLTGVILRRHDDPRNLETRDALRLLDSEPVPSPDLREADAFPVCAALRAGIAGQARSRPRVGGILRRKPQHLLHSIPMIRLMLPLLLAGGLLAQTPATLPKGDLLWPDGAPGAQGNEDADKPTLYPYVVPAGRGTGTAVVVCPGGGYAHLSMEKEGSEIARWLNSLGVSAFVLQYRLGPKYHHPIELGDAQRAIRTVRSKAAGYRLSTDRIGIMGFSAGGHLASSAGTHFDAGDSSAADPIDRASSRPDFLILCYPVISFLNYAHQGSKLNLLGPNADPKLVETMSSEMAVTAQTPPTFLFHTTTDATVPAENSALFYMALRKAGVPAELHIYERGPHGVGLSPMDEALSSWPQRLSDWLRVRGLLNSAAR